MAGFVDAGVDRPPEMLQKRAVDAVVDPADAKILVDDSFRLHRVPLIVSKIRICTRNI
jgi:hypothetical protein